MVFDVRMNSLFYISTGNTIGHRLACVSHLAGTRAVGRPAWVERSRKDRVLFCALKDYTASLDLAQDGSRARRARRLT